MSRASRSRTRWPVWRFAQLDIVPVGSTPEEYGARIRATSEKYAQAVRVSGARID